MNTLNNDDDEGLDIISDSDLSVPLILQQDDYSCVPCSIKMVLDCLSELYPRVYTLEIDEIAECIGTTELGTCNAENLDNINDLLIKCIPSIEFVRDHTYPSWKSIVEDLQVMKPVILWIECRDNSNRPYDHSIVVEKYRNRKVFYKDSISGDCVLEVGKFLKDWESVDRFTIRVKVDERKERKITEYADVRGVVNE